MIMSMAIQLEKGYSWSTHVILGTYMSMHELHGHLQQFQQDLQIISPCSSRLGY